MEKQHSYTTGSLTPTEPLKSLGSLSPSLSCSNSSLASNYSSVSIDSNSTSTSLSNQIAIHLMFYNSIEIISRRYAMEEISFRVATMDMTSVFESTMDEDIDGGDEYPTEIAVMNNVEYKFHQQIRNGRQVLKNELVLFRSRMPYTDQVGVRVDLFRKTSQNDHEKIAFCYIYPLDINQSNGICTMPITTKSGKIIARVKAQYFITKPYEGLGGDHIKIRSKIRSHKSWQLKKDGFDIGHRGAGVARRYDRNEKILENTVDSFNFAFKEGADMVELDVQLSKDKVPIVYHDFNVNIVLQKKDSEVETMEMNIKDLTYKQLQLLKFNPILHGKEYYDFEMEMAKPSSQPFASFQMVLESVEPECGFNVEIKYPQKKINGMWEAEKSHDLNEYVDLILQDLFLYAGERNIIISSFHPEIVSLVKLKQDRYPVLFLTQGLTTKWLKYENPLNHSIEMATYLAASMELYGIAVHAEDIIKNRSLIQFVKSKSMILFCWGEDLNDKQLIKTLKKEGVDGAIYDKIDLLVAKELPIKSI